MRGLVLFTLNSTYVFAEDGDVQWIPNDRSKVSQEFGDFVMYAESWYKVADRPTEPTYDAGKWGTVAFSIMPYHHVYNGDKPISIVTSRVHAYTYVGEGDSVEGVWRDSTATFNVVKDIVREHYAVHGARYDTTQNRVVINYKASLCKQVMERFSLSLTEALNLIKEAVAALFTVEVKINDTPLADWERELLNR